MRISYSGDVERGANVARAEYLIYRFLPERSPFRAMNIGVIYIINKYTIANSSFGLEIPGRLQYLKASPNRECYVDLCRIA